MRVRQTLDDRCEFLLRGACRPFEAAAPDDGDAQLLDRPVAPLEQVNRHRVEHLVAQDQSAERIRELIEPLYAIGQMWHSLVNQRLLAIAQIGRHFENAVMHRR